MIHDQAIQDKILEEVVNFCKKNTHTIVEGFPKTLNQALAFQKKSGIPDKVIFVNVDRAKLKELCFEKLKNEHEKLTPH